MERLDKNVELDELLDSLKVLLTLVDLQVLKTFSGLSDCDKATAFLAVALAFGLIAAMKKLLQTVERNGSRSWSRKPDNLQPLACRRNLHFA
ncbi:hypothetical protein [Synechococcus sp. UW105]|uniref:hypothetical protein n=1 Tax=Synechococcus sp. UW105 TaxID=337067 RepID=UPI000E0E730D|nr:hypothetical protein [Synechococcus sp. UW105]